MNYQKLKECVIAAATAAGLEEYELYYSNSNDISVQLYQSEVNKFSTSEDGGVCFRCIVNGKMGYASTELFTEEEARNLVERAMDNAASIETEDEVFIYPAGDTYREAAKKDIPVATAEELIQTASKLQKAAYDADSRVIDGTQTYATTFTSNTAIYNSKGLDLSRSYNLSYMMCMPLVSDGSEMYDGDEVKVGKLSDINCDEMAKKAVSDAIDKIDAGAVTSGKYDIVFSGKMIAALLATFCGIFSAESAQKGLSLLKGKEGTKIASDIVTLVDDPFYQDANVQASFDAEGVATYTKNVIENGTFCTLLYHLASAKKAGVATTGNASKGGYAAPVGISPYSFYIKPVEGTKEDLFAKAGNSIYVTELNGMHAGANAVTGDFSLSAAGYLIQDGKKTNYVKNFTVSANFYTLLADIAAIGADLEFSPALGTSAFGSPSVLVKNISVAGKSE